MARRAKLTLNATAQAAHLPEALRHTRFRSQLEINFALQLEARHVRWFYEPERLCRYLVDFYLPECRFWIEVKGRLNSRDHALLRDVAAFLAAERKQRLFMYTSRQAYAVSPGDFSSLSHAEFWQLVKAAQAQNSSSA
ncbi:MAG: hypothetical protein CUN49_09845 [Candidatus Thermofonsia Clade 1 bacterium]|jgi:hypothetical protein|uniref:DUF4143 domain-containing protein n=1 Tax=Candidatus Thermofonsia Clade 1 bacterium TaxID=2364210 RepID=A0A2M8PDF8_9CHLR|nr:MAG: hypothetical protein CUN49_09845 [Candidatus Thermofonsia Clade 1 bacterium]RMF52413.1 MAG: hypothetical protein D6749_05005 [Chloroflexota bacterium]